MVEPMRVLTVRQPWAWAIIHGGKDVENRTRNIAGNYRGPVAIHAGMVATWGDFDAGRAMVSPSLFPDPPGQYNRSSWAYGAIIGVVDLTDVIDGASDFWYDRAPEWAEPGRKWLMLTNPRPLTEPIPYKGALGLRKLPVDIEAQIRSGLS